MIINSSTEIKYKVSADIEIIRRAKTPNLAVLNLHKLFPTLKATFPMGYLIQSAIFKVLFLT